jgi:hypothetical protein
MVGKGVNKKILYDGWKIFSVIGVLGLAGHRVIYQLKLKT